MKLEEILEKNGITLDSDTTQKLNIYSKEIIEWNSIHNLTGAKSIDEVYQNILDSIYPIKFIQEPKTLLDIGSGAGFPAMVLGIVWSNCQTTLCEPRNKRASFLRYIAVELELQNIKVEKKRVEDLKGVEFELITSRAVNRVELLLNLSKHLSSKSSKYLLFKGEMVFEEIKNLNLDYEIFKRGSRNYLFIKGLGE